MLTLKLDIINPNKNIEKYIKQYTRLFYDIYITIKN
jgi:hypothetical protein